MSAEEMSKKLKEAVNFFICRSNEKGGKLPLTNKKLQKLLYYTQAWNLVLNGEKLFEEDIEAWIHGPAIPIVYRTYKSYGRMPIMEEVRCDESVFTKNELKVLKEVWRVYGKFDGDYLEILSHSEDPWMIARGKAETNERLTEVIDPMIMKEFYAEKNK